MMRLRQVGRAVEHEHGTRFLELVDGFPGALNKQHVTGAQTNHVQVTGDL